MCTIQMKLFHVYNTSNNWWIVAPDMEAAIDYSYENSRTQEKKNLLARQEYGYRSDYGLNELLKSGEMGFVRKIERDEEPYYQWIFVDESMNVSVERYNRIKSTTSIPVKSNNYEELNTREVRKPHLFIAKILNESSPS